MSNSSGKRDSGDSKLFDFESYRNKKVQMINRGLSRLIPKSGVRPATLHQAMRYSLFAGGKRIRPILCLAAAEACGGRPERALHAACAVECIHTYSLIHDDLPAMDNDDMRRGKPTNHKVYGEGVAVLAGDALLTIAFESAAKSCPGKRYGCSDLIREIAEAGGSRKLIGGQVADLEAEGKPVTAAQLKYIHESKTSALLCCSVRLGGMLADCSPVRLKALTDFGTNVGLAFQVIDDILDVTQSSQKLGKTAGKDAAVEKATYPAVHGLEKSRATARRLTKKAFKALEIFEGKALALQALAEYLLDRDC
jgi:geranylgeranyl diphosphate synthase type II